MALVAIPVEHAEDLWRCSAPPPKEASAPWCLGWLYLGLVFQFSLALLGLVMGSLALIGQVTTHAEGVAPNLVLLWAGILFWLLLYAAASFSVIGGLESRVPWGWAAGFGLLFCRIAGSSLMLVTLAARTMQGGALVSQFPPAWLLVGWIALHLALAVSLFRGRRWFGVPEREAWRTLRQRGGWALCLGGVAEVVPALVLGIAILSRSFL